MTLGKRQGDEVIRGFDVVVENYSALAGGHNDFN